jgi:histone H3/H4
MDPTRPRTLKKDARVSSASAKRKKDAKGRRRKRDHIPRSDVQLLASRAGIRVLVRKIGSKYGNTRVAGKAIDFVKEETGNYTKDQILTAIDIASKCAHLGDRKTVLASDMEVAFFALDLISNKCL